MKITLTPTDAFDLLKPPFTFGFKVNNVRRRLFRKPIGYNPKKVNEYIKAMKKGDYKMNF